MIRSKPFIITMAVLCGVMVLVCIPLGLRFWGVFQGRRTFGRAVELFNAAKFDEALPLLDACIRRMPRRVKPYQMAAAICAMLDSMASRSISRAGVSICSLCVN